MLRRDWRRRGGRSLCESMHAFLASAAGISCPANSHGLATLHSHVCSGGEVIPAVRMCVWPPAQDRYISGGIISKGTWLLQNDENIRRRMVCDLASASQVGSSWIMDVGTNIGTISLPLLAAGFNVLSFEAFGPNAAMFNASVGELVRAQGGEATKPLGISALVRKAVTTPGGPSHVCMSSNPANAGGASVAKTNATKACSDAVPTTTIDYEIALRGLGTPIRAAKMDIEGHEHLALQGAERLFSEAGPPPSIFFVEAIRNRPAVSGFLSSRGFTCDRILRIQHDYRCRLASAPVAVGQSPAATARESAHDNNACACRCFGRIFDQEEPIRLPGQSSSGPTCCSASECYAQPRSTGSVPNLIHFTHPDSLSTSDMFVHRNASNIVWNTCALSWRRYFPPSNYQYRLWSDAQAADFVRLHCERHWDLFRDSSTFIHKADLLRYCLLFRLGGIYSDLDYEPRANFLESGQLPAGRVSLIGSPYANEKMENSLMASPPGQEYWMLVLDLAMIGGAKGDLDSAVQLTGLNLLRALPQSHNTSVVHLLPCHDFFRPTHMDDLCFQDMRKDKHGEWHVTKSLRSCPCPKALQPNDASDANLLGVHWGTHSYGGPSGSIGKPARISRVFKIFHNLSGAFQNIKLTSHDGPQV